MKPAKVMAGKEDPADALNTGFFKREGRRLMSSGGQVGWQMFTRFSY